MSDMRYRDFKKKGPTEPKWAIERMEISWNHNSICIAIRKGMSDASLLLGHFLELLIFGLLCSFLSFHEIENRLLLRLLFWRPSW